MSRKPEVRPVQKLNADPEPTDSMPEPDSTGGNMYTLVVRPGCHLCEQAEESLAQIESERGIEWRAVNIDDDPALAQYSDDLPVLLDGPRAVTKLTSSKVALDKATKLGMWSRIKSSLHFN